MLNEQEREDLIEKIAAIFTNEADARAFNDDPDGFSDENLPEGTEAADVAAALPEVGERTGLDFSNVASTGGGASAAGELSHTYTTIYQQNSFIYAEEGSQVTNIQGNDNAVAQQDIDVDIDVEYGEGETEEPAPEPEPEPEPPLLLREVSELPEEADPGSPDPGFEEAPDPVGAIDLEFSNTADAGEAPQEAPEPEPVDDIPDV